MYQRQFENDYSVSTGAKHSASNSNQNNGEYQNVSKRRLRLSRLDVTPLAVRTTAYFLPPTLIAIIAASTLVYFFINDKAINEQTVYLLFAGFLTIILLLVTAIYHISCHILSPIKKITDAAEGFNSGKMDLMPERRQDEIGQLIKSINTMSKGLSRKSQVERVLDRFLDKDIAQKIVGEIDSVDFQGKNIEATVLFADIVGFTNMSERLSPTEISQLLNEYFGYFSSCAKFHFGTVDKFIGDCIMIVFGGSQPDDQHEFHAVACALLMQQLTRMINTDRKNKGLDPIYIRIGINSGPMLAGLLGSTDRMEYTVIGDSVNLASRLCNEAEKEQIIIQESMYQNLSQEHKMQTQGEKTIKVRGKSDPVTIYNVTELTHKRAIGNSALINDLMIQYSRRNKSRQQH